MIEEIRFNGVNYPKFQSHGYSAQYIFPVAEQVCNGIGYDIGCAKLEWALPGSIPIDKIFDDEWDALNLPGPKDYIFSSHCLEHIDNWVDALEYWVENINKTGTLFLYLPHYDQQYWRPWNNRKHKHVLRAEEIVDVLKGTGKVHKIHYSERDINHSFTVMCEKR
jgi:hypothetical protein